MRIGISWDSEAFKRPHFTGWVNVYGTGWYVSLLGFEFEGWSYIPKSRKDA